MTNVRKYAVGMSAVAGVLALALPQTLAEAAPESATPPAIAILRDDCAQCTYSSSSDMHEFDGSIFDDWLCRFTSGDPPSESNVAFLPVSARQDDWIIQRLRVRLAAATRRGESVESECYKCYGFNSCHSNEQPGTCDQFHNFCPVAGTNAAEAAADLEVLLKAATAADVATIEGLFDRNPDAYSLNLERRAIQVADCRGTIAAHIPLGATLAQALSARLTD